MSEERFHNAVDRMPLLFDQLMKGNLHEMKAKAEWKGLYAISPQAVPTCHHRQPRNDENRARPAQAGYFMMSANNVYSRIGFGCVAIIFVFLCGMGPALVRDVGLSPLLFPVFLVVVAVGLANGEKYSQRRKWAIVLGIGAALSAFVAVVLLPQSKSSIAQKPAVEPSYSQPELPVPTAPSTPIPTPVETPIAMPTQSAEAPARRIIKTSIDELLAAYAANQVAAAKKYGNASIQLEGRVVRVREALGSGILVLKSPISGETYEFGFSDEGTKMLESLKPGDRVSITCPTVLEAMSIVMIEGCSDVELK